MAAERAKRELYRPEIHIGESDYDLIAAFALRIERSDPELSRTIFDEIDRAQIHADKDLPAHVVAIGSEVEFVDERNGEVRRMTLVLPGEAEVEAGRISVMSPMGVGLIGLSEGQSIDWPYPDGRPRTLRIGSVRGSRRG
jgi:regulator of nucleoside diphosphate kinase